jgi:hypothetical protein
MSDQEAYALGGDGREIGQNFKVSLPVRPVRQRPAVGRIVHYVSHGTPILADGSQEYVSRCRAALVVDVLSDAAPGPDGVPFVQLAVFSPEGMFFPTYALVHDVARAGGTWHWPERVD